MNNKNCFLCGNSDIELFHKGTRDNKNIDVLKCKKCGLVFLSSFEHIHNEFYENSGMYKKDNLKIQKWREITYEDDTRRANMLKKTIERKDILDFGCGNGGFLEYSKLNANRICGIEIDRAAREDLISHGYTVWEQIDECDQEFDIITLFHVLEHLENPVEYLLKLKGILKKNSQSQIIIEIPNADDALVTLYHSEPFADFTYWSLHLYLFNHENINLLANKAGLKVNWVKQIQRYSLANHLYWLSEGKPGGHNIWSFMEDEKMKSQYEEILGKQNMCDTLLISLVLE